MEHEEKENEEDYEVYFLKNYQSKNRNLVKAKMIETDRENRPPRRQAKLQMTSLSREILSTLLMMIRILEVFLR